MSVPILVRKTKEQTWGEGPLAALGGDFSDLSILVIPP